MKKILLITIGIIVGVILLFVGGMIVGIKIDKKLDKPIYIQGERASFLVSDINIFSWSDLEGVCYSKVREKVPDFNPPHSICFVSRGGGSPVNNEASYNVACNCYGTNYNLRK